MKDKLLWLLLAGSFVGLAVEIRYEHRALLEDNRIAWVPIIYGVVAAVASLAAMGVTAKAVRWVLAVVMLAGVGVGMVGTYYHIEDSPVSAQLLVREAIPGGTSIVKPIDEDDYPNPGAPPVGAPAGFIGLSGMGVVLLLLNGKEGSKSKNSS